MLEIRRNSLLISSSNLTRRQLRFSNNNNNNNNNNTKIINRTWLGIKYESEVLIVLLISENRVILASAVSSQYA